MTSHLSELEKARLENIRRNEQLFAELGLSASLLPATVSSITSTSSSSKSKSSRAKAKSSSSSSSSRSNSNALQTTDQNAAVEGEPLLTRRSLRIRGERPDSVSGKRYAEEMAAKEEEERAKRARKDGPVKIVVVGEVPLDELLSSATLSLGSTYVVNNDAVNSEVEQEVKTEDSAEKVEESQENQENSVNSENVKKEEEEKVKEEEEKEEPVTDKSSKTRQLLSTLSSLDEPSYSLSSQLSLKSKEIQSELDKLSIRYPDGSVKVTKERIYSAAFHPSTDKIILCAGDKTGMLSLWDVSSTLQKAENEGEQEQEQQQEEEEEPHRVYQLQPHTRPICGINYLPNDHYKLVTCSYDCSIRVMDVEKAIFDEVLVHPEETWLTAMDIDSVQNRIWFTDGEGYCGFRDLRSKEFSTLYPLSHRCIRSFHLNPTNPNYFVTSGLDQTVRLFDARCLKKPTKPKSHSLKNATADELSPCVTAWTDHNKSVTSAYWTHDGKSFVTTSYDDTLRVYQDVLSGEALKDVNIIKGKSSKKATATDYSATNTVRIPHNNQTGRWVTNFRAIPHRRLPIFACANMNRSIDVYDTETGDCLVSLFDAERVTAVPAVVAFHPSPALPFVIGGGNGSGRMICWTK